MHNGPLVSRRTFIAGGGAVLVSGCDFDSGPSPPAPIAPAELNLHPRPSPPPNAISTDTAPAKAKSRGVEASGLSTFVLEGNTDTPSILPCQPLPFTFSLFNKSDQAKTFPRTVGLSNLFLTTLPEEGESRILWPMAPASAKQTWWTQDGIGGPILSDDCLSIDHLCHHRVDPSSIGAPESIVPLFDRSGTFEVQVSGFSARVNGWLEPPLLVSEPVSIEIREPTIAEGNIAQRLMDAYVNQGQLRPSPSQDFVDEFRAFLAREVDSPVNDDVRYALYWLLVAQSHPTPQRQEYDFDLLAEGYNALFAISPTREILYRRFVDPAFTMHLTQREMHRRIDVPAWLTRFKDHPPFPDRSEFASRRKWLAKNIQKIETSLEEEKRRPIPKDKKLARA